MKYAELLSEYIENSGFSLGELAIKMEHKGIKVDRSYISKIKNGTKPPASEEVNRALAEITGGDPEKLIISAYKEKAPKEVQELLDKSQNVDELLNNVLATLMGSYLDVHGKLNERAREQISSKFPGSWERIESNLRNPGVALQLMMRELPLDEKLKLLDTFVSVALKHDQDPFEALNKGANETRMKIRLSEMKKSMDRIKDMQIGNDSRPMYLQRLDVAEAFLNIKEYQNAVIYAFEALDNRVEEVLIEAEKINGKTDLEAINYVTAERNSAILTRINEIFKEILGYDLKTEPSYHDWIEAIKLRHLAAHFTGHEITHEEAQEALKSFKELIETIDKYHDQFKRKND